VATVYLVNAKGVTLRIRGFGRFSSKIVAMLMTIPATIRHVLARIPIHSGHVEHR
jgi:hypothetical protein